MCVLHPNHSADPFAKKDWYDIKAPSVFNVRNVGKTLVTRTQGTKVILFRLFRTSIPSGSLFICIVFVRRTSVSVVSIELCF